MPDRGVLERLIAQRAVEPVFQPIIGIERSAIAAYETLTRPSDHSGFPDADRLFDAAERHGLLWELEEVTRARALAAASEWEPDVLLFLNCSPQVFADPRFADNVLESVHRVPGLAPGRVVLEITERSEQQYTDSLATQVDRLKALGFQIAIDDVGAGTSGLNRIMRLQPQWLKLDRDLIRGIDHDRVRQNLVRFLLHFARLSRVRVVAEGVESHEELATVIDLGVSHAQGFVLARPGTRAQELSEGVLDVLRRRSTRGPRARRGASETRVIDHLRSARVERADTPAGLVPYDPDCTGVVVQDGNRLVGWCWRTRLEACPDTCTPLRDLVEPNVAYISPDSTLADAYDLALSRGEEETAPLVVIEGGRVLGVISSKSLLGTAIDFIREQSTRRAPLTGLPGRVLADEHLARAITAQRAGGPSLDVAIIDLRHFFDYNAVYGYDLGDQLLMDLAQALADELPDAFLAHLGGDHFLLSAPAGLLLARLPDLAPRLEAVLDSYSGTAPMGLPNPEDLRDDLAVRVVLLRDATGWAASPRQVHAEAGRLRAQGRPTRSLGSRCLVIESDRDVARRQSA
ncbi:MAG: EAL domain-containing protein [Phycisphaerae bacterium]|nr:EAL domain-containing protein [Phycisphaerae bacterium]